MIDMANESERYHEKLDSIISGLIWLGILGFLSVLYIGFFAWQAWDDAERSAKYAQAVCQQIGGVQCDWQLVENRRHPTGKR